jgi:predicted flap endonuclease-1-like 5' DNA nuclease
MFIKKIVNKSQNEWGDFPKTSRPAARALAGAGYTNLDQLAKVTQKQLLELHGMGPKAIRILKEALKAQGKSFKK